MFKNAQALKSKLTQFSRTQTSNLFTKSVPKRFFSYQQRPSGYSLPAMFGIGLGTAGLMYLMRYSYQMKHSQIPTQQMNFFNPVVQ